MFKIKVRVRLTIKIIMYRGYMWLTVAVRSLIRMDKLRLRDACNGMHTCVHVNLSMSLNKTIMSYGHLQNFSDPKKSK